MRPIIAGRRGLARACHLPCGYGAADGQLAAPARAGLADETAAGQAQRFPATTVTTPPDRVFMECAGLDGALAFGGWFAREPKRRLGRRTPQRRWAFGFDAAVVGCPGVGWSNARCAQSVRSDSARGYPKAQAPSSMPSRAHYKRQRPLPTQTTWPRRGRMQTGGWLDPPVRSSSFVPSLRDIPGSLPSAAWVWREARQVACTNARKRCTCCPWFPGSSLS